MRKVSEELRVQLELLQANEITVEDAVEYLFEAVGGLYEAMIEKRQRFVPPTREEVIAYNKEIKGNIDPEKFISSYEQKGWMVGKNKMKSWKAAMRNWHVNGWGFKDTPVTYVEPQHTEKEVQEILGG